MDEDTPLLVSTASRNTEDADAADEMQDYRFLTAMTGTTKQVIPKRGEKDFEPHGTMHQDETLAASRRAMHAVLDHTRVHQPKSYVRAWFLGDATTPESPVDVLSESVRGRGLERNHVVMVESPKGSQFKTMGKAALGILPSRLWLLPEEALYLVERGNLDLWWPNQPLLAVKGEYANENLELNHDHGWPLSLQAAYCLLIGNEGEEGKISLESYIVYSQLRRNGYSVLRPSIHHSSNNTKDLSPPLSALSTSTPFEWLFRTIFPNIDSPISMLGPLVRPGLYRSYDYMYRNLCVIPRYRPFGLIECLSEEVDPSLQVTYLVWKPSRTATFAKSKPGDPDFRISVVSSRSSSVPSLSQLASLLARTPYMPPKTEWSGPDKMYQRLKHGWRNIILAVVDEGITSFIRVSEAAFGEEKLTGRFDRGGGGGRKGGTRHRGGANKGRGRGR